MSKPASESRPEQMARTDLETGAWGRHLLWIIMRVLNALLALGLWQKRAFVMGVDALLCIFAMIIAFSIRYGEWAISTPPLQFAIAAALASWIPISQLGGTYRVIFRFAGSGTMLSLVRAVAMHTVLLSLLVLVARVTGVPRTIGVLHGLVFLVLLGMSRVTARYLLVDIMALNSHAGMVKRVLVYGAGPAGKQLAAALRMEPGVMVWGYVDDDARLEGRRLDGLVIRSANRIDEVLESQGITDVILALPRNSRAANREIVRSLARFPVHVRILPPVGELMNGTVRLEDVREINIEDLLGRDPVPPNELLLSRTILNKTVAVTGAGGSIGSELCRQILALRPQRLLLVEVSEFALYQIEQDLQNAIARGETGEVEIVPMLVNVCDRSGLDRVFRRYKPQTVFHAAAYKHVPLVERNVAEGIRNNVAGTLNCVLASEAAGVERFILISSDKAVRPTNVMGASKRICELICQARAEEQRNTTFAMVRFGNVLGSSGSVVPLFEKQIREGGPVTITHRDVTRYFMTIPEAAQLVIQAGAMARGGEVYVLDMGQAVRIADLAREMIRLAGLTVREPGSERGDVEILEVGLRPGEKMYEELLIGDDPLPTLHERIMQAREHCWGWSTLDPALAALLAAADCGNEKDVLGSLGELVPEYRTRTHQAAL